MFERFARSARAVVVQSQEEARALGARTVEAEHLLLALSVSPGLQDVMERHGAGHDALTEALELEFASALETVGVSVSAYGSPAPVPTRGSLRFGTSAKRALEQTLREAVRRDSKRLEAPHMLAALLLANHGTVPRTLELSSCDQFALLREARTL